MRFVPHRKIVTPCERSAASVDAASRPGRGGRSWWLLILLFALTAQTGLHAATVTWSGGGGDDNWSTAANWGGTAPIAGDALVFAGTTRATPNNDLTAATSFASITFSAGATAFTIGGNSITLAGNLTNSSAATQVINLAMILSGAPVISCATDPLTLGGILSGSGSLTVSGASTVLTLSVNNTYTGSTTISQGAVNAGGTGLGTGLVTVSAGATLTATGGAGVTSRYFNVTPSNSSNVNPKFAALTTLQTHLNGQALAAITNATTLNFGTTGSSFPSPYNSGATNFEAYYSAKLTIASTATYTFNTSSDDGSMLFVDGTVVVSNNFFQGVVTRTGSISLTAGVHDLVVAFYQGTGTYGLNAQISGAGNVTMVDITTANASVAPAHLEVASLAGAGSVVLTNGDLVVGRDNTSTTFSGVISGGNGVTKLGTGTLTLTGTNTITGSSRISAGTLQIGAGGTAGTFGSGAVINNATLTFARSDAVTASNVISGVGAVVMNGSGTLTLNGTSTYTGTTTISQGTLQASGCALGTGAVTVATGATLAVTGGNGLSARYFNVTATGSNFASLPALQTHLSGQTMALANVATNMNFGSSGTSFPSPYNSGSPVFEAIYSGRLTIGTAGTYTFNTGSDDGSVLFVDGAVVVNNNFSQSFTTRTGSLALTTGAHDFAVAFYNGGGGYGLNAQISGAGNTTMVDITTANATLTPDLIIGSLAGAGTVQLTDGSLISGFNGTSTTFSGTVSGACGLVKRGAGTLTLSGTATYTGTTTAAGGTLKLASGSGLGNTAITVCSGATFAPNPSGSTLAIGTTGAGTLGSMLTLGSGTVYDMTDGAVGTVALQQNTSFASTPLTISGATLNFNIGSAGPDTLAATLGATTSGTNSISMTAVGANLTVGGSYPVITATSGLAGATWQITGGGTLQRVQAGSNGYILTLSSSATAITITVADAADIWNGTTSTDWNDATNWSTGAVPTLNNDVQIGNGSGTFKATPSLTAGNGVCQSVTFTGSAAAIGAGGGTLTIGAGGITASVAGSSIACPVALGASQTWTSTVNAMSVSGVISGAFALTKTGSGAVTLSGANTFSGGVTLSAGSLNINNAAALGAAAGTFTIASGTTIDNTSGGAITIAANNPMAWSGDFTFTGSNALNLGTGATALGAAVRQVTASASTLTVGGVVSGTGGVNKTGSGTLALNGADTFTGGVTLTAGTLAIGNAAALGAAASTFTIAGGTLDNTSGGALTIANNNPQSWSGDFTFTGTNALNLGTGAVALGAGTRQATVAASTLTVGGIVSGTGGVTKLGGGTLTLNGANTFSGGLTLSAGTLNIGNAAALGGSASTFTIAGGTTIDNSSGGALSIANKNPESWTGDFTFTGTNALNLGGGAVALGAATRQVTVAASTLTVGGMIGGTGGMTKAGSGILALSALNTYTGATTILAGTVSLVRTSVTGFGTTGTGWTLNGGATVASDVLTLTSNASNQARSAFFNTKVAEAGFTATFQYQASGNKAADGAAFILQNSAVTSLGASGGQLGYSGITPSVALAFNLFATNTTGTRYFTNGTVTSAYTTNSPVVLTSGDPIAVTLTYDGTANLVETLTDLTTSSTFSTTLAVGTIATTLTSANAFVGFSGGTGGSTSTQTISNFIYTSGGALPAATALAIASGATLDLGGCPQTLGSLADSGGFGGTVTNSGSVDAVLTVSGSASTTFSGVISDGGTNKSAVTRGGTGSLTLSGTSTYTGATTVSGGTLVVTGATASGSAATVSTGGTLAGTGTVAGTVTMGATGTLAPGTGGTTISTLTTGTLSGNATSIFSVDLDGVGPTSDRATTAGTVTCAGTLTVASAGNAALGSVYTIVSAGTVTGTFAGLVNGAMTTQQGRTFQIAYTGTAVTLTDVARPTTRVWDGGGANNNWTTAANWDFDLAPVAGEDLQFAGSTRTSPNNDFAAATSFASITFNSGASAFTVAGNAITLAGAVTNGGTALQRLNVALAVAATRTVDAASGDLALGGVVSGVGGLTKAGTNILTLSGANTYSGATTVSAGTLTNGAAGVIADTSAMTVASGATWNLANFSETVGSLAGAGSITLGSATLTCGGDATSTTLSGVISGTGAVAKAGAGTMTLSGANTYTGATTVSAGTLTDGAAGVIADASAVTVSSGATWNLNNFNETIGSLAGAGSVSLGTATLTCGGDNTSTTYSGVTSGSGNVTKTGTGTYTLSGTSTMTGKYVFSGGVVSASSTAVFGPAPGALVADYFTMSGGGLLITTTTTGNALRGITLAGGGGSLSAGAGLTFTEATVIAGTGTLTTGSNGTGIVALSGANTFTGAVAVVGSTLRNAAANVVPDGSAVTVSSGATWDLNNFSETIGSLAGAGNVTLGSATVTCGGDNTATTYSGVMSGSGGMSKAGTNVLTLSGVNTYTGATTVAASGGTLAIGSAGSLGSGSYAGNISLGTGTTFRYASSAAQTLSGIISGAGALTKDTDASSVLTLSGTTANTYTGVTTVSGGVLILQKTVGVNAIAGNISIGDASGGDVLRLGASDQISDTSVITFTSGGSGNSAKFELNGYLETVAGITSNANQASVIQDTESGGPAGPNAPSILTVSNTVDFIYDGLIRNNNGGSGSLSLTKSGTGTLTLRCGFLTGQVKYTGATTINGGTLVLDGLAAFASATTVNSGGTVAGNATTTAAITLASGGTIAPGLATGAIATLTTAGVTSVAGSTYAVDLDGTGPTADRITSSGIVALASAALTVASNTNSGAGKSYTIVSGSSVTGTFSGMANGSTFVQAGRTFQIVYTATSVTLSDVTGVANGTKTWNGGGADGNWTTASNWVGGIAPIPGDSLIFAGSTRLTNANDFGAGTSFNSITLAAGGGAWAMSGNALALSGGAPAFANNETSNTSSFAPNITFTTAAPTIATTAGGTTTIIGTMNNGAFLLTAACAGPTTISGVISNAGGLTKTGGGTLTLSGVNTYTGSTTISAGTLTNGAAGVIADTSAVTVASGATWNLANFDETVGSLAGAGSITLGSATLTCGGDATSTTLSGVISGTGAVSKTGSGTMTMTGASTYDGATTVSAGTLDISGGGSLIGTLSLITQSGGSATITNGTVTLASSASSVCGVGYAAAGTGTITVNAGGSLSVGNGGGRVFVGGSNGGAPFGTGVLTIAGGTVTVGAAGAFPNDKVYLAGFGGVGTINLDGGTLSTQRTFGNGSASVIIHLNGGNLQAGAALANLANSGNVPVDVRNGGAIIDTNGFAVSISGVMSHSTVGGDNATDGGLTKNGSGTLTLSANNTFTGTVTVNAGTLSTAAGNTSTGAVGSAAGVVVNNGGTISVTGDNAFTGSTSTSKTIQINAGGVVTSTGTSSNHLNAVVLNGGTLSATTANGSFGNWNFDQGVSTLGGGTTSTISGGNATLGQTGGATFAIAAGDAVNVSTVIALTGSGADTGLIKSGSGTLTLSAANTYASATAVSAGTLLVTGSLASGSAVSVGNTATLGGTGTVAGTVALAAGATLAPGLGGTAIGTLTTGSVTCNAASTLSLDLDGTTPTNDRVTTAGTVACAGTLTVASNANAAVGKVYTIVSAGTVSGTFSGLATNTVFTQAGRLFRIAYTATAVTLTDIAPVLTARQTLDADGNGHLDRIRLTFDMALNDDTSALTVTVAGYTVTGFSTGAVANDNQIDVLLTELGAGDTGATPAVRITANTSLKHTLGSGVVQVEGSATAATDAAAPVLLSTAWTDGGTGGVSAGDTVTLTFSESVTATAMTVADLGLPVTSDTLSTTTIANQTGTTITMTLAGSPRLTPGGTYSAAATGAAKPSGVFVASGAHLQDAVGLAPATGNAASALDLGPGTSTVAIAWATGSDPRTWALGAMTVGTTANSITSSVDLTVQDTGDCNVDLSIASAATAPSSWGPAASAGANAYLMKADTSAAASGAPTDPTSYALTLTTSAQTLTSGLLSGATSAYALYFQAPTSISSGSATQQTIVISITAALAP